jgi:hypothetical protein
MHLSSTQKPWYFLVLFLWFVRGIRAVSFLELIPHCSGQCYLIMSLLSCDLCVCPAWMMGKDTSRHNGSSRNSSFWTFQVIFPSVSGSFLVHVLFVTLLNIQGIFLQISGFFLCAAPSSPVLCFVISLSVLVSPDSQLHHPSSGSWLGSTSIPSPYVRAWKVLHSRELGHWEGLPHLFSVCCESFPSLPESHSIKICLMYFIYFVYGCFR